MASLFTAQLHPGRALGILVLGASLHDILTRLKAEPQRFPKLDLVYSPTKPVEEPVTLNLPANGIRLRFDGPEQRLRLIEVIDFTKNHITFKEQNKERDLVRPANASSSPRPGEPSGGPTFRHIYQRFLGPTYDGEFVPSPDVDKNDAGTYVLSYPGVAFTFPMARSAYTPSKDVVSLLSSANNQIATSMAVFSGESWAQACDQLWTEILPSIKTFTPLAKGKDVCPDEISLVRIHGGGRLQLFRKWTSNSMWITLGDTTPQELVAELGPPDAIFRKNDQRMYIHKIRTASSSRSRANGNEFKRQDDLTDTDQSSAHTTSDDSGDDEAIEDEFVGNVSGECFYNYFYLGFDVLISTPTTPSLPPPSQNGNVTFPERAFKAESPDRLVTTKLVLHGNVPGSYPFNRHRRSRWEISYLDPSVNSETPFSEAEKCLHTEWKSIYASEEDARQRQRGMVLNRGWGDSPGSSVELLGGWEESGGAAPGLGGKNFDGSEDSTTTLYGFPGLVFEVLRNGFVSALTVF
ncbi:putative upf0183 domain containing protein [Phaeoacremonium minimum UCRPA7]|uniref:Putative upf0183 domain containing protein n=1 Tax=Phaeoacremonium minimum (strain UCR-PA7) TaxID=1286976 RepID=R8BVB6_PHAM7|nr:putative upf0183 domain containing protein [Phaeoacremonium minimum UCRPA7]EOO03239.1 putative upf0183 domain containing protein [Phaeoacremonium minimum UCRPA7]